MLVSVLVALAAGASPGGQALKPLSQTPVKVAALELSPLNMDPRAATFYSEHIAQQLEFAGLRVTTSKQIATLVGFERQRSLLQCTEGSASCVAELANALGVDGILIGDIGKFGNKYQFSVKVLSAQDGRVLSAYSMKVDGEEALIDGLTTAANRMAPEVAHILNRPLEKTHESVAEAPFPWGWVGTGTGAALAAGGAFFFTQAADRYAKLSQPAARIPVADADRLRSEGVLFQNIAWAGVGLGAAAIAGGVTWMLLNPPPKPQPQAIAAAVVGSPDGFAFVVTGVLP